MTAESPPDNEAAQLTRLAFGGFVQSQAIHAAVVLEIPDAIGDGARDAESLAAATGAHAPTLRRLMRALVALGVAAENEAGRFSLTAMGGLLRADVPGSLRMSVLFAVGHWYWRAFGEFVHTLRTGEPAFDQVWGMNAFEFWERHPEAGEVHDRGIASLGLLTTTAVLSACDFSRFRRLLDVGGGTGTMLAAVLKASPELRGTLFDLAHVIDRTPEVLRGVGDRCALAAGSFFEDDLPPGHDALMLKWILHDWDDERSLEILRACRAAIDDGGTLLVVERVLDDRASAEDVSHYLVDLMMAVVTPGGRERTRGEFEALLGAAGFRVEKVVATASPLSLIEARPV